MQQVDLGTTDLNSLQVAGVDEAGRGPLFGDVIAAAVVLDAGRAIVGLADSKTLSHRTRERLYEQIYTHAAAVSIGRASVSEIDRLNILQASMLAMQRAVVNLQWQPKLVLIDGNRCPQLPCRTRSVIKGDAKVAAISAASIVAKVTRDREIVALHHRYPGYGLDRHKGYPTKAHLQALKLLGPTPLHRRSFAPVSALLSHSLTH